MSSAVDRKSAASALADLFFLPVGPSLSDAEVSRANDLRKRYRDWRCSKTDSTVPPDVLDLKYEAQSRERRSTAKGMKRVRTVGARMQELSPVRALRAEEKI